MTLDELETLCKMTRYHPDPPRFRDERESETLQLVLKLIAVARAAQAVSDDSGGRCDMHDNDLMHAMGDALKAMGE